MLQGISSKLWGHGWQISSISKKQLVAVNEMFWSYYSVTSPRISSHYFQVVVHM